MHSSSEASRSHRTRNWIGAHLKYLDHLAADTTHEGVCKFLILRACEPIRPRPDEPGSSFEDRPHPEEPGPQGQASRRKWSVHQTATRCLEGQLKCTRFLHLAVLRDASLREAPQDEGFEFGRAHLSAARASLRERTLRSDDARGQDRCHVIYGCHLCGHLWRGTRRS